MPILRDSEWWERGSGDSRLLHIQVDAEVVQSRREAARTLPSGERAPGDIPRGTCAVLEQEGTAGTMLEDSLSAVSSVSQEWLLLGCF